MQGVSFGSDGWRTTLDEFTLPRVRAVGRAVAAVLDDEGRDGPVVVGHDARDSSPRFAAALESVLVDAGRDVAVADRDYPTPLFSWAVADRDFAGGLMVTASHNPPNYNGVKFIRWDGAPAFGETARAIEAHLGADPTGAGGSVREIDVVGPHAEQALALAGDPDLSGLTVAYDAMHGSGRGVTDALLERAGAEVVRVRCDRIPDFGGTAPEPKPDRLTPLVAAVEGGADFGIANDGDADRVVLATPDRGVLNGGHTFALLYDHLLDCDAGPAVRSVSTTSLVDRVAAAHGQSVHERPVGFGNIAAASIAEDPLVAGEETGGFALRGHIPNRDGVANALVLAAAAATRPLDRRLDAILDAHGPLFSEKVSVPCPEGEKERVVEAVGDRLPDAVGGVSVAGVSTVDGFKVRFADGSWLLLRPSNTEPKMRVYAEAESEDRLGTVLDAGRELVSSLVGGRN
ncbi:MAG: phosphoglucomutase/phosphomannomutase family protein [Halobacteriaceae archaeon]